VRCDNLELELTGNLTHRGPEVVPTHARQDIIVEPRALFVNSVVVAAIGGQLRQAGIERAAVAAIWHSGDIGEIGVEAALEELSCALVDPAVGEGSIADGAVEPLMGNLVIEQAIERWIGGIDPDHIAVLNAAWER